MVKLQQKRNWSLKEDLFIELRTVFRFQYKAGWLVVGLNLIVKGLPGTTGERNPSGSIKQDVMSFT